MKHEDVTGKIIAVFYEVYNELGHGFLESVYQTAMRIALTQAGMRAQARQPLTVFFRGEVAGEFFIDVLVEEKVILELKSGRALAPEHEAQLLNYLRATNIEVGMLLNFGPKPEFRRFVFDNERKRLPRTNTEVLPPRTNTDERG